MTTEYRLDTLPEWRPGTEEDHALTRSEPYQGMARWSGRLEDGLAEPPVLGTRVVVCMNGFGPGTVTGYFVEFGWLGLYVQVDNPPDWWVKQRKQNKKSIKGPFGGPMVFGMECKGEQVDL